LVTVPGSGHSDDMLRSLLTLSDVMATGHHAAVCADVRPGGPAAGGGAGAAPPDDMLPSLLTLPDVVATGHHAAVCADVRPGGTVAVVGDGAVGLSGVLAAKRLGAGRIPALSRNPVRQEGARGLGATELVEQRGEEATEAVMQLTGDVGVDATLECVGTGQAMHTA